MSPVGRNMTFTYAKVSVTLRGTEKLLLLEFLQTDLVSAGEVGFKYTAELRGVEEQPREI
jgi:hypothetical protein